ncbi:MAG: hypothetical protein CBB97_02690 [Candidatus Endolissoclinum sp. TMED37]|nr:MAG: hypothetical protein CBB97_02690 [Candidatus Endolissoclinum sp. TMED37]
MFNIFRKSRPKLLEYIPKGFVDIHSHILPGIDDGCKNNKESIELIRKLKKIGFAKLIGTPHTYSGLYDNTNESIETSYLNLKKDIDDNIVIDYASEYFLEYSLIEKSERKTLLTLKENYVLVEMGFISEPIDLFDIIFNLQLNGYSVVLAHPERYLFLLNNLKMLYKLKNVGCMFQINLFSIVGYYGPKVLDFTNQLLDEKLVDFFGTDIHRINQVKILEESVKINNYSASEFIFERNNIFN